MTGADWIVSTVRLSTEARARTEAGGSLRGICYPFHVSGVNLNYGPAAPDRRFSWQVPDLDNPRYDLGSADIEPAARAHIRRVDHG